MPFITEEIWQKLKPYLPVVYSSLDKEDQDLPTIMLSPWPEIDSRFQDSKSLKLMSSVIEIIQTIRNIRAELNVPTGKEVDLILAGDERDILNLFSENKEYLLPLAKISSLDISYEEIPRPDHSAFGTAGGVNIYLLLEGIIDIEKERKRLEEKKIELFKELQSVKQKLENKDFLTKAKPEVVEKVKNRFQELEEEISSLDAILASL
jgi:valyl-tRNA synthetase